MHSTRNETIRTLLLIGAVATIVGVLVMGQEWLSNQAPASEIQETSTGLQPASSEPGVRDSLPRASAPRTATNTKLRATAQDEEHTKAPDFERVAMDGSSLRLSSFRGRVVVLNFWATWCTPCRVEIPEFITMQRELDGVQFIGVSLDEEGFDVVRPYAEEMGITYPLVIGDDSLAADFGGIMGLPTSYVIDREGLIRQRFIGMVNEETLRPILADLLAENRTP